MSVIKPRLVVYGCHFIGGGSGDAHVEDDFNQTTVLNGIFIADDDERALALRVANRRGLWDRLKVAFVVLFARRNNL